ncbi:hypothetical protein J1614_000187 [Plenodomus biglobosus]|nr:hypothetical protein J1614_000187 [Plenodomus biglobosus]
MSNPEPAFPVLSSPLSSVPEIKSPKSPNSPASPSFRAKQTLQSAPPSPSSISQEPLQAYPMNPAIRKSPKRTHQEVEDQEEGHEPPRKYRAASHCEDAIAATPSEPHTTPTKTRTTTRKTQPKPPPVGNSNRPSRARKPPKEFWVIDEKEQNSAKKSVQAKKSVSKVFDPAFITSNSTSRLGKADIYHLLLEDLAWTSLSRDQQKSLLSMLPPSLVNEEQLEKDTAVDEEISRPQAFTLSNDCFRTDVAKFKEDLQNGHLAKTWQAAAEQAAVERAAGKYDEWKAEEAEMWWGQKSK